MIIYFGFWIGVNIFFWFSWRFHEAVIRALFNRDDISRKPFLILIAIFNVAMVFAFIADNIL